MHGHSVLPQNRPVINLSVNSKKNTQDCRGISCTIIDIHCISVGDGVKSYHLERPGWRVLGCT